MARPNARIFTCRFTMFHRRTTPKPACWWWTRSARRECLSRSQARASCPNITPHGARGARIVLLGVGVAADERPIEKIPNADGERNDAERGSRPDVPIRLDARNQSESGDVTERAAHQQDTGTAGTRRLVQFRLHRNVDSAGNRREALFAAQLAPR